MKEVHCRITGRVQMVMYRAYTKSKADKFGLTGIAKNNEDGSVEVIAQGKEVLLQKFVGCLKRGSVFSSVKRVEAKWREPEHSFSDFSIIY